MTTPPRPPPTVVVLLRPLLQVLLLLLHLPVLLLVIRDISFMRLIFLITIITLSSRTSKTTVHVCWASQPFSCAHRLASRNVTSSAIATIVKRMITAVLTKHALQEVLEFSWVLASDSKVQGKGFAFRGFAKKFQNHELFGLLGLGFSLRGCRHCNSQHAVINLNMPL